MIEKYLNIGIDKLAERGGVDTAREISGQPDLWISTWDKLCSRRDELHTFLETILNTPGLEIVLAGAGTSGFIGDVAESFFGTLLNRTTRSIATTTLVTHFKDYINTERPLLLISFGRSGNSPESKAVIDIAEQECRSGCYHLIITCNAEGTLAGEGSRDNAFLFLLPPGAEDQGLAMTGSFTSMLLAALLIAKLSELEELKDQIHLLSKYGEEMIERFSSDLYILAQKEFGRAVFLGSGPLLGIARESHLKLQELTDGRVICKHDSFLGFRHGPKAVIDPETVLIYLLSGESSVRRYEADLIKSISENGYGFASVGVCEENFDDLDSDIMIDFGRNGKGRLDSIFLPVISVLPAQILGFYKSLNLGMKPDSPSKSGAISRVVEGVTIYHSKNRK